MARTILTNRVAKESTEGITSGATAMKSKVVVPTKQNIFRSKSYLDLIQKIDLSTKSMTSVEIEKLQSSLAAEIGDSLLVDRFVGFMAKCRLGPEYHVHTLSLGGGIIKHYLLGEAIPSEISAAVPHALNPRYEFIEIYRDRLVCVYPDGRTTEIIF